MRCWKSHHDMIVNATLAFLMGFFMGVSILLIEHTPINWVSLVTIWAKITFVVTVILMVLPVGSWGSSFAELCKCKNGSIAYTLVENLVPTFIINTVLAAVVPALGIFYNNESVEGCIPGRLAADIHHFILLRTFLRKGRREDS